MTKAHLNLHPKADDECLSVLINKFTKEEDGLDFRTVVMTYGGAEITMYFRNPESFVNSLKKLIECAQAQLDAMVPTEV